MHWPAVPQSLPKRRTYSGFRRFAAKLRLLFDSCLGFSLASRNYDSFGFPGVSRTFTWFVFAWSSRSFARLVVAWSGWSFARLVCFFQSFQNSQVLLSFSKCQIRCFLVYAGQFALCCLVCCRSFFIGFQCLLGISSLFLLSRSKSFICRSQSCLLSRQVAFGACEFLFGLSKLSVSCLERVSLFISRLLSGRSCFLRLSQFFLFKASLATTLGKAWYSCSASLSAAFFAAKSLFAASLAALASLSVSVSSLTWPFTWSTAFFS